MAAPLGNRNAAGAKRWEMALVKALARFENDDITAGEALDRIAMVVVEKALHGDRDSILELANRLNGKPVQQVEMDVEGSFGTYDISDKPLTIEEWEAEAAAYMAGKGPD
jgi:hypothetical protein